MSKKQPLTSEELYKRNEKIAKILKIATPIVFWGLIALAVFSLICAVKNSFGNIEEIINLLDNSKYTGEELNRNYNYLLEKYGEWNIGNGGNGFAIQFVNIGKALFSGLMITNSVLCVVFFASAFIIGKWFMPMMANKIIKDNQDMVNLTILKNNNQ